jgi:hypothetical protein
VLFGLKHNRLGTHTPVMFLGNDSNKFPNLSKSLGGDSVQIKPDQIKVLSPLVWNTTSSEHTPVMFLGNDPDKFSKGGDSVQIKPDQTSSNQIKSNRLELKCCVLRFES